MISCEYCTTFKNTYFEEHLRTNTSFYEKEQTQLTEKTKQLKQLKFKSQWKSMGFQFRKLTCLQIKIQRKMHTNLNKCQVESCPALPGRYLISTCKRRVESVPAGRVKVSFRQTRTMQSPPKFAINVTTLLLFTDTFLN